MISKVIDSLVMVVGAFIIGWHLVPPDAERPRPASEPAAEAQGRPVPALRSPSPSPSAPASLTPADCPESAPVRPATASPPAPDPDELPQAYRDILGPLSLGSESVY